MEPRDRLPAHRLPGRASGRFRPLTLLALGVFACALSQPLRLAADDKSVEEVPPRLAHLPAENPYLPLLLRLTRLSTEERSVVDSDVRSVEEDPAAPIDSRTAPLAAEIARALAAAPPTSPGSEIWPLGIVSDSDNQTKTPPFQELRLLTRLSLLEARRSPHPSTSIEICAGVSRLGRSLRTEPGTIVHHMIGVLLEDHARRVLTARMAGFSRMDLDSIEQIAAALPPAREGIDAFVGEFDFMEITSRRHFLSALKLLAADPDPRRPPGFTLGVRLRGVMTVGEGQAVILLEETSSKTTKRMAPGETWHGYTFERISDDGKHAHLHHAEGPVVLDLSARTVAAEPAEIARLRESLRLGFIFADDAEVQVGRLMESLQTAVRSHPADAEGYLADSLQRTRTLVGYHLSEVQSARIADIQPPDAGLLEDPLVSMASAGFAKVTRSFAEKAVSAALFSAALRLRRHQLGGPPAPLPLDPCADGKTPFAYEKTSDGGFILRSAFETSPGVVASFTFTPAPPPKPGS